MTGSIRYSLMIGNTTFDMGSVAYTESTQQEIVIANGASDTQLNFGGITTVDILYLKSDQALTLNINSSSGTDLTIDANKPFFTSGTSVTAAYVSNASGSDANVIFKIWGA